MKKIEGDEKMRKELYEELNKIGRLDILVEGGKRVAAEEMSDKEYGLALENDKDADWIERYFSVEDREGVVGRHQYLLDDVKAGNINASSCYDAVCDTEEIHEHCVECEIILNMRDSENYCVYCVDRMNEENKK